MTFRHESGFFVEPQMQVRAAFLKSYDYDSDRGMRVDVDGDTSILGRAGLAGLQFCGRVCCGRTLMRAPTFCTSSRTVRMPLSKTMTVA